MATYKHFLVDTPLPFVAHVQTNRPEKYNAFYEPMWLELKVIFDTLSIDPDVRSIVFSAVGPKAFTAGLDVQAASEGQLGSKGDSKVDTARKAFALRRHILEFQECVSSLDKCEKPIIIVMHGFSLGLAIDLATSADIRICSADVKFAVKEVDIGLAADVGTLSRLPKVVGNLSWIKDVAYSARIFGAKEALAVGFVSQVHETKEKAIEAAFKLAELISSKSPIAVQGTKELLNHAREHTIADSLRYTGVWNSAALQTSDVERAMLSGIKKTFPRFEKL